MVARCARSAAASATPSTPSTNTRSSRLFRSAFNERVPRLRVAAVHFATKHSRSQRHGSFPAATAKPDCRRK
jgi:hypothetical protein